MFLRKTSYHPKYATDIAQLNLMVQIWSQGLSCTMTFFFCSIRIWWQNIVHLLSDHEMPSLHPFLITFRLIQMAILNGVVQRTHGCQQHLELFKSWENTFCPSGFVNLLWQWGYTRNRVPILEFRKTLEFKLYSSVIRSLNNRTENKETSAWEQRRQPNNRHCLGCNLTASTL
jgi:hypothetical protein